MRKTMLILLFFITLSVCIWPDEAKTQGPSSPGVLQAQPSEAVNAQDMPPVLSIAPREIDLGVIQPGEIAFGEYTFRNLSKGKLEWSTAGPEGWDELQKNVLKGAMDVDVDYMRLEVAVSGAAESFYFDRSRPTAYQTIFTLESGGKSLIRRKDLKPGAHRLALRIASTGGQRTIFVAFRIVAVQEAPAINLNPQRLDMGGLAPGTAVSRRIEMTNSGKEMLTWSIVKPKTGKSASSAAFKKERYISFYGNVDKLKGSYTLPEHLKNKMELLGKWTAPDGYPQTRGAVGTLKYAFYGTGIKLYLKTHSEEGNLLFYINDQLLNLHDWLAHDQGVHELVLAEHLPLGQHVLTVVCRDGRVELEGAKTLGMDVMRGPAGWMTVFPISGTTTSETDYINVRINTDGMAPGYYADEINFRSNGGEKTAEVYVEVYTDASPKIIDVFLYSKEMDFVLTSNPQAEAKRFLQNGYAKEGIAFRLFAPDTPGTTAFYRWFNPDLNDHYYSTDRAGGSKKLDGYVFEGAIGNIATSRMTNTRELYRWVHPSTGRHYYSTDPKGGAKLRRGYRFDGIAGYVR
ncbi:MAG TPA: hypothetical protein PK090_09255 [Smithellaceae bacterium]|nr:hypothetical protein [Smithellaceae bacterium]